ncbi:sensor histidine kinase [Mycobacteroides abscessus]|uniref:sensor histidine kinase n=1 Tax=Mycobacteroides abscessus TaxID=36809 RepID=UPI0009A6E092|nr:HAMP domain-containing sensor histidine kinase [Mycobacteroides abscessus]SKI12578.1 sensor histidine kinase TcrY [Mycobacteroides abscessus subsp. massiliense]SKM20198.1 sensor histidine kinase TcrY [Mycobacteroides abscessus subsp. massiliense]
MCSEQRASTLWRYARPGKWSLRARLLAVQVALLALVCLGVGAGTLVAMNHYLNQQLDQQLRDASARSVVLFELGRPSRQSNWWRPPGPGPDFLDAPGQSIAMIGALASDGRVTEAAIITSSGARQRLTVTAYQLLESIPLSQPSTVDLDQLGHYRVLAAPTGSGTVVITGLPAEGVENTLLSVFGIFCAVGTAALVMAATAGVLITRRQLAPLSQVATAAQDVADMELQRGEVVLPNPIVEVDPDRAHTEIGQLGAALNQMLERIAEALSARHVSETRIRQFVADASHELRTPLATIRGYAELAQRNRDAVPADVGHAMARVHSEATRMTALVEDLLLLARIDSGRPLAQETVDLSRLIVDAVSDAHIAAPEHSWSLDLPQEPVMVTGDGMRLHQVAANLLSNCRVHTPPGTTVTVSLAQTDTMTYLIVADNGPGIPEKSRTEIFERFARADTSRSRRAGSTGLGLAIATAIVSAHHGTIRVDSIPGATAFTVALAR